MTIRELIITLMQCEDLDSDIFIHDDDNNRTYEIKVGPEYNDFIYLEFSNED